LPRFFDRDMQADKAKTTQPIFGLVIGGGIILGLVIRGIRGGAILGGAITGGLIMAPVGATRNQTPCAPNPRT
jgi:hypothetical protein